MKLEKANSKDNEVLTAITKKSKAYWGYSDEQIKIWSELLTITPTYIETSIKNRCLPIMELNINK